MFALLNMVRGQGRWRRCIHRSHRLHVKCWRGFVYDGYCTRHNRTCWGRCGPRHAPWSKP